MADFASAKGTLDRFIGRPGSVLSLARFGVLCAGEGETGGRVGMPTTKGTFTGVSRTATLTLDPLTGVLRGVLPTLKRGALGVAGAVDRENPLPC